MFQYQSKIYRNPKHKFASLDFLKLFTFKLAAIIVFSLAPNISLAEGVFDITGKSNEDNLSISGHKFVTKYEHGSVIHESHGKHTNSGTAGEVAIQAK